jgi:HSP20 family molecular chaperone IbpA
VDVVGEPDQIRITAELPGVMADDIQIQLHGSVLTTKGGVRLCVCLRPSIP